MSKIADLISVLRRVEKCESFVAGVALSPPHSLRILTVFAFYLI